MNKSSSMNTLKKVLRLIRRYRIQVFFSIFLSAVSMILQLYVPILFGEAIDHISAAGADPKYFVGILMKIVIVVLIYAFASWLMNLVNNHITYGVVEDLRKKAIRKIQDLPLSFLDQHSTGDIVGRVIADADQLSDGLLLGFSQLFSGIVTIFVTLYFMFSKSISITLMVLVMTPISLSSSSRTGIESSL